MAKVAVGAIYGDLYVEERLDDRKLKNGTYMFRCTCVKCGTEQSRAHGNLLNSRHPSCIRCGTAYTKSPRNKQLVQITPSYAIQLIFRKDLNYLTSSGPNVPTAVDNLPADVIAWLVNDQPEMVVCFENQKAQPLTGVNYHELQRTYALRKLFPDQASYDLPKFTKEAVEKPKIKIDPIQSESFEPPPSPLRDEYLTIDSRDFRFFNHDHPLRPEDVPPNYLQNLVAEFEKKYGDIADYTFSSSPAPGNQLFIYWTKPTNTVPPLEWEPVELAPVSIVSVEDDKAMVVSTFNWNENPGL